MLINLTNEQFFSAQKVFNVLRCCKTELKLNRLIKEQPHSIFEKSLVSVVLKKGESANLFCFYWPQTLTEDG